MIQFSSISDTPLSLSLSPSFSRARARARVVSPRPCRERSIGSQFPFPFVSRASADAFSPQTKFDARRRSAAGWHLRPSARPLAARRGGIQCTALAILSNRSISPLVASSSPFPREWIIAMPDVRSSYRSNSYFDYERLRRSTRSGSFVARAFRKRYSGSSARV